MRNKLQKIVAKEHGETISLDCCSQCDE
jgi:hypothetical protein